MAMTFIGRFNMRFDKLAETALGFGLMGRVAMVVTVAMMTMTMAVTMIMPTPVIVAMIRFGCTILTLVAHSARGRVVMVFCMRHGGIKRVHVAGPHIRLLRPVIRFAPPFPLQMKCRCRQLFF